MTVVDLAKLYVLECFIVNREQHVFQSNQNEEAKAQYNFTQYPNNSTFQLLNFYKFRI